MEETEWYYQYKYYRVGGFRQRALIQEVNGSIQEVNPEIASKNLQTTTSVLSAKQY